MPHRITQSYRVFRELLKSLADILAFLRSHQQIQLSWIRDTSQNLLNKAESYEAGSSSDKEIFPFIEGAHLRIFRHFRFISPVVRAVLHGCEEIKGKRILLFMRTIFSRNQWNLKILKAVGSTDMIKLTARMASRWADLTDGWWMETCEASNKTNQSITEKRCQCQAQRHLLKVNSQKSCANVVASISVSQ